MATNIKFQSVKHEKGVNYVVYKTNTAFNHADENGSVTSENYITKSALTLLKEGGDVMKATVTTLSRYINANAAQVQSLIAKAAILAEKCDVTETEVKPNVVKEGHSETFKWYHHEISNVIESQMSRFAETDYFKAVDAFSRWCDENAL